MVNPVALFKQIGINATFMVRDPASTTLPYVVFFETDTETVAADNIVYAAERHYAVEVYYEKRDTAFLASIEKLFTDNGIYYDRGTDSYIQEEGVYMTPFYI